MIDETLRNFKQINFQNDLIDWFYQNKRKLPWRETTDPYYIWVSEVMLQQTKVDTVIDYYNNFITQYPSIFDLAAANEQEVLKQWEGLGYYSRARNLHEAVKEVVAEYDGIVPNNPTTLGTLKGIGPYTQGAIMSIAFNEPEPAVDGNVMRVLARVLLIYDNVMDQKTRRRFETIVREIISKEDPSAFNQALMELGALICIPRSPRCDQCPIQLHCRAFKQNEEKNVPVRIKKSRRAKKQYITVCLFNDKGHIAIEQRSSKGLLANMWQFPMFEKHELKNRPLVELFAEKYGMEITIEEKIGEVQHVFSHLLWDITVHYGQVKKNTSDTPLLRFVMLEQLEQYPISVAHQKIQRILIEDAK